MLNLCFFCEKVVLHHLFGAFFGAGGGDSHYDEMHGDTLVIFFYGNREDPL